MSITSAIRRLINAGCSLEQALLAAEEIEAAIADERDYALSKMITPDNADDNAVITRKLSRREQLIEN